MNSWQDALSTDPPADIILLYENDNCFNLHSCVFESPSDLKVKIVNISKSQVYVSELGDCDSCGVMIDARIFCSGKRDTFLFPRLLNAGDSTVMRTKLLSVEKVDIINADSLEKYCNKGSTYNITNKEWVKVISQKVDMKSKTCRIVIQ